LRCSHSHHSAQRASFALKNKMRTAHFAPLRQRHATRGSTTACRRCGSARRTHEKSTVASCVVACCLLLSERRAKGRQASCIVMLERKPCRCLPPRDGFLSTVSWQCCGKLIPSAAQTNHLRRPERAQRNIWETWSGIAAFRGSPRFEEIHCRKRRPLRAETLI
jgi:hypothetical protein